jgi:hypothetical protein
VTRERLARCVILAGVLALVGAPAAHAQDASGPGATEACASPSIATSTAEVSAGPTPTTPATPATAATPSLDRETPDLSRGRWTVMARAPFGSEYEPVAWTGRRMVVVDGDTGRTAVYVPSRNRWREGRRAPRRFDPTVRWTWTGTELVLLAISGDGRRIEGAAYDPAADRWRKTASLVTDPDGETDHALADALWTGSRVVVVDSLGLLAAYDPAADRWVELGRVPGEPWAWRLYPAGSSLLVESRRWDEPVEIRAFDPATLTWSEPSAGPLHREASEGGGVCVDGRLVYLTWSPLGDEAGASHATFDPVTMAWSTFEHDCFTTASGILEAEGLLIASDARRALDGRTLACVDLPVPPRRLNGTERAVWTGRELIAWSGLRSLDSAPRRDGLVFRPTGTR